MLFFVFKFHGWGLKLKVEPGVVWCGVVCCAAYLIHPSCVTPVWQWQNKQAFFNPEQGFTSLDLWSV